MKKLFLLVLLAVTYSSVNAQNIQTHYDLGDDRQMLTTTIEMFKADDYGSTFFFVDFNYGGKAANVDGVSLSYLEIARDLKFWDNPFTIHAEYNSGMLRTSNFAAPIHSAYLLGGGYTFSNSDFSKTLTLLAMYKYIDNKKQNNNFQLTAVWGLDFFDGKVSFTGFSDFWKEDHLVFDDSGTASKADFVFLTEPQLWYNFNDHLSAGTEIEISSNFGAHKGVMINPTLAMRWTF
ncbi:DUF5020 family protein [Fodinibius halophilus]|uniref:DUF5020 family protein n=1 Tax=Fodinibius halophilus TaxID=1736908 RepID=A0A6M1TA67_9BACT|nr:DUF5020 family protein [Fodinibius halophilus]NGP89353.1 DUF5020 family protein [Fodinibius halophilus]